jgi:hypothetical protein
MADPVRQAPNPRPTGRPAVSPRPTTTALCLSAVGAPDPRTVVRSARYCSSSRRSARSPHSSHPIRCATVFFRRATAVPALPWEEYPLSAALPSLPPYVAVSRSFHDLMHSRIHTARGSTFSCRNRNAGTPAVGAGRAHSKRSAQLSDLLRAICDRRARRDGSAHVGHQLLRQASKDRGRFGTLRRGPVRDQLVRIQTIRSPCASKGTVLGSP